MTEKISPAEVERRKRLKHHATHATAVVNPSGHRGISVEEATAKRKISVEEAMRRRAEREAISIEEARARRKAKANGAARHLALKFPNEFCAVGVQDRLVRGILGEATLFEMFGDAAGDEGGSRLRR